MQASSSSEATDWGGELVCSGCTEDLKEKIIALMPFPAIFKARCLSKSWRTKLSPIKPNDDEESKAVKYKFQSQVGLNGGPKWSNDWGTFGPVIAVENNLFAYDRVCRLWRRRPLPEIFRNGLSLQIEGALLYGFPTSQNKTKIFEDELCVANIFTGTYQELPRGPSASSVLSKKLVKNISTDKFEVILLCRKSNDHVSAEIYHSDFSIWTSKELMWAGFLHLPFTLPDMLIEADAYVNGVFYMVERYSRNTLLAFNVEGGTVTRDQLSLAGEPLYTVLSVSTKLSVCNDNLLIIFVRPRYRFARAYDLHIRGVHVLKIDLGSLQMVGVGRIAVTVDNGGLDLADSDGDHMFLSYLPAEHPRRVLSYNFLKGDYCFFPNPEGYSDLHCIRGSVYLT